MTKPKRKKTARAALFPGAEQERLSRHTDDDGATSRDKSVDAMSEDSFPASDPPGFTCTGVGGPKSDSECK